eukprot:88610-Alexandrium_andersonii.AAC.1
MVVATCEGCGGHVHWFRLRVFVLCVVRFANGSCVATTVAIARAMMHEGGGGGMCWWWLHVMVVVTCDGGGGDL